jgi:phosphatidylglycerophosphatase A
MKLWIAQGFGAGRIPFAPGTFGSLVGLGWLALLLCGKSWLLFAAGCAAAIALSVWLCGEGEKRLNKKDPGSVVLDEIAALPVCFTAALAMVYCRQKQWPGPEYFFSAAHGLETAGIFVLFRLFDIVKPWPVRQSQALPGGWGITVDDVLAAGYVNVVVWGAFLIFGFPS